ncbi:MAG: ATP-binding protein [Gammaproteobacteria bacterium]|nr:ATP-binding protein [Gammaproteobacteria bacterium]
MLQRSLKSNLLASLEDTPVVLINGARQVGKSTLARQLIAQEHSARYLTFDDNAVLVAAKTNPQGFIRELTKPVVLDEVQHVPEIFPAIKEAVDTNRVAGNFLLTGSANILLLPTLAESLAGRMEILTLWPLAQCEIENCRCSFVDDIFQGNISSDFDSTLTRSDLIARIIIGGFPEAVSRSNFVRRSAWFRSYVSTMLLRDIRDLAHIANMVDIPRLLQMLAGRCATIVNFAELARSLAMPQSTLKRYFALLETIYMVRRINAWSNNLSKRVIKAPKLLLTDTGVLCHLLKLDHERLADDGNLFGHVLENFVIMELVKQAGWSASAIDFFHYRNHVGEEVDLVMEGPGGKIVAVEIKASANLTAKTFMHLEKFADSCKERFHRGIVFYTGNKILAYDARIIALPIDILWR